MSLNARWRNSKIVIPQTPDREQELIGGLQNALLRGETIDKAKQSFISAGYKPEEIEAAAHKISITPKANQQPSTKPIPIPIKQSIQPQITTTTTKPKQPKKLSKKFLIIMISISILVLIGAALLGIFWNKIF
jgi:hypothetical protein